MKGCSKDGKECGKDSKDAKDSDRQEVITNILERNRLFSRNRLLMDSEDVVSRDELQNSIKNSR